MSPKAIGNKQIFIQDKVLRTIHLAKDLVVVSLVLPFAGNITFAGNAGGGIKAGEIKACENTNCKLMGYCNKSEDG